MLSNTYTNSRREAVRIAQANAQITRRDQERSIAVRKYNKSLIALKDDAR